MFFIDEGFAIIHFTAMRKLAIYPHHVSMKLIAIIRHPIRFYGDIRNLHFSNTFMFRHSFLWTGLVHVPALSSNAAGAAAANPAKAATASVEKRILSMK